MFACAGTSFSLRTPCALTALVTALFLLTSPLPVSAQTLRLPGASGALTRPAAESTEPRPADFIVAIVNSEPITNNEVQTRLARIEQQLSRQWTTHAFGPICAMS